MLHILNVSYVLRSLRQKKNLETHDLKYHMKKGISNVYSCEYCSISFSAKINLLGHITNQHKKRDVCQNIFQSKKVLEAHERSVHTKVQLKHTIEREPSFKIIRTRNKLKKWLNIKGQIVILVKVPQNI